MTHEPTESESSGSSRRSILKSGALLAGGAVGLPLVTGSVAATGCAYTPGYWRNHTDVWPGEARHIHFGTTGDHGGNGDSNAYYYFDSEANDNLTVLQIFEAPVRGDKSLIMAKAYAAAILNGRNETQDWCIHGWESSDREVRDSEKNYLELAQEFFDMYPPGSGVRRWHGYEYVKDALDAYNNGEMCVCGGD